MISKKERARRLYFKKLKIGKSCETCGSKFDLTIQHRGNSHMNRAEKKKHPEIWNKVNILCKTCHFLEDHSQMMRQSYKAELRKYDNQCRDLANRYGWRTK